MPASQTASELNIAVAAVVVAVRYVGVKAEVKVAFLRVLVIGSVPMQLQFLGCYLTIVGGNCVKLDDLFCFYQPNVVS